jgi:hypothetical protein
VSVLGRALIFFGCLIPLVGSACGVDDRKLCNERFRKLISYRASAIEYAFGDPFALPDRIDVEFFAADHPQYGHLKGRVAYDSKRHVLLVSRSLRSSQFPNPLSAAQAYWPFYQDGSYRDEFKIIGAIDNALWTAYLQEAAEARGLSWPHAACGSLDVGRRLPCEMVLAGIVEHVTTSRLPLFNENRLDTIWPEDFARFRSKVWLGDPEYANVKRYGGILLMRPLRSSASCLSWPTRRRPLSRFASRACERRHCAISSKRAKRSRSRRKRDGWSELQLRARLGALQSLLEIAGIVPLAQLVRGVAGDAIYHATTLHGWPRADAFGPTSHMRVFLDAQERACIAIQFAAYQRAVPRPRRHVGDRVAVTSKILRMRQSFVEDVELSLHFHCIAIDRVFDFRGGVCIEVPETATKEWCASCLPEKPREALGALRGRLG